MKYIPFHITSLIALFMASSLMSCKQDTLFPQSPSERTATSLRALRDSLTSAPYGWVFTYFPETDSLLFSNPNTVLNETSFREHIGYGGHYFVMKFSKDGKVEMTSDESIHSATTPRTSEFQVEYGSNALLSFKTLNYIHRLINHRDHGTADFNIDYRDSLDCYIFHTNRYNEAAKEYICMRKLKSEDEARDATRKAYENRKFFDEMENPQISIRRGDNKLFESDINMKRKVLIGSNVINAQEIAVYSQHRYYLFTYRLEASNDPRNDYTPRKRTGLGSGYVGTEFGLSFRAGIRYDKHLIFYDFKREGDRFVSIHRDNFGVPTGYVAIISTHTDAYEERMFH